MSRRATAVRSAAPAGEPLIGPRWRAVLALKLAIEQADWEHAARILDGAWLWAFERPEGRADFIARFRRLLAEAWDVKLLPIALLHEERRGTVTAIGLTCCLMWAEAASWEECEVTFDLHLGVEEGVDERVAFVGLGLPTPEFVPFPEDDDVPTTPARAGGGGAGGALA